MGGHARQCDWDLAQLMERLDGDRDFLKELLVIFQQDAPCNLEKLRGAVDRGDFEEATRSAHTLKGMLKNLAMTGAAQAAAKLEEHSRKGETETVRELLHQLEAEFAGLLPEVGAQLAEVKS